jgi:hypothetical protein
VAPVAEVLDIDQVQRRAEAVLAEPLFWFPVRHHSPNVARHLRAAMIARKPKVVFMEGPHEANGLIKHIVDARTKPPIALYSSYRDDDNVLGLAGIESPAADIPARFAVWYPMLPYSPEYVAMKTATELGIPIVLVDLPNHAMIRSAAQRELDKKAQEMAPAAPAVDDDTQTPGAPGKGKEPDRDLGRKTWELLATESQFYKQLADTAGYRNWNECWDSLFEVSGRHGTYEEFRRDLAYFCSAVRATTPPQRMAEDGTLERERHMWQTIQKELKERGLAESDAMMVCGGFHLYMDRKDTTPPPPLPAGTLYSTVAPYSYYRTSELSGYGAGNRAPKYYQLLWEGLEASGDEGAVDAMVFHSVAVLARGRKEGEVLSSADAIAVTQHSRMLATLRGRKNPTLDDIQDALISCCCKGKPEEEGKHLLDAMRTVEIGTAVGRVTPEMGQLPLVHDFYHQVDLLDLGEVMGKDKKIKLDLDLRDELGNRRSIFLHRMTQLGVPMAKLKDMASDGATLFKEFWDAEWSPKVESDLIEKNLYGDSVEAAAVAMLDEELAKENDHAGHTCARLLKAVNMDLPGMVLRMEMSAGTAIDTDRRLSSLAEALTHLIVLDRLASHRKLRRDVLQDLLVRCFGRACFSIPDVANVPPEEHEEVMHALQSLAETCLGEKGDLLDKELFKEHLKIAFDNSTTPYLRGVFAGLLTEIKAQTPQDLAAQVAKFAHERPEVMLTAGEFIDGEMAVSKTSLMLGAESLVGAIDELVKVASWDQFVTMLPRLRNAFERLHDRQRNSLADRVATLYGLREDEGAKLATLSTSAEAAVQMAEIDARVAEIMKEWSF